MKKQIYHVRKINIRLCLVFVLVTFFAESVFFFLRLWMQELGRPVPQYLTWHLLIPTGVNLIVYLFACFFLKHYSKDEKVQNYVPVMTLVIIAGVIGTFHYSYSILMTLFLMPVFLSSVYGDRDLCGFAVMSSIFGETVLLLVRWYETMRSGADDRFFLPEAALGYAILIVGGMTSFHMVDWFLDLREAEAKDREMEKAADMGIQMVTTLVNTIEAKDPYTNGHSNRVAMYAREIAARAGKDEAYQHRLFYMSILHDIGKIGIPDRILTKTDELTPEEMSVIQTHPMVGAQILEDITQMPGIEIGARNHHEWFDGRGYPDGLAGEAIPEEARIIAVADAYDAMTSERSYRHAFEQAKVRQEMVEGRGTQFDPQFLDIMLDMIDHDQNYAMHGTEMDDLLGMVQLRALLGSDEEKNGALQTSSAGFEEIYHFLRRYARRNACEVQLVLITMEAGGGALTLNDAEDAKLRDQWMGALAQSVKGSIRQTDVECRLGLSQYIVILTDTNRGNANIALTRIRHSWDALEENPGFRLAFEVQDINGEEADLL